MNGILAGRQLHLPGVAESAFGKASDGVGVEVLGNRAVDLPNALHLTVGRNGAKVKIQVVVFPTESSRLEGDLHGNNLLASITRLLTRPTHHYGQGDRIERRTERGLQCFVFRLRSARTGKVASAGDNMSAGTPDLHCKLVPALASIRRQAKGEHIGRIRVSVGATQGGHDVVAVVEGLATG